MKYLRWLLLPFSLVYGLVVSLRNWLYDTGIFKSRSFNLPVISVGNLAVGGAGKSPMTEYIVRLLKPDYRVATLSRGYGRTTKGYLEAERNTPATQVGDEPAQFKQKFPDITVAVCEKRVTGIEKLSAGHDVVIMDDAYQHRAVKPGLSILLYDYTRLHEPQLVLPAGNLREPAIGRWRADLLVVSKCPVNISQNERQAAAERIKPNPFQKLFFTSIAYMPLRLLNGLPGTAAIDNDTQVFLLTGIANPAPMVDYIKSKTLAIIHHNYPDHHQFSLKNISKLAYEFAASTTQKKLIVTTEKDAQRLGEQQLLPIVSQLPFWILPIGVTFIEGEQEFAGIIQDYVREHTTHHRIH